ncbi:PIG-L family deacetylase [Candidatus Microgenomates bacterium]|nr:PIG-L family deacetylase [Candidatus Microgenomates bacterium]
MIKKILCIFAHPDDESFGPGGTLAKYAKEGVQIEILCATRGEAGKNSTKENIENILSETRAKEIIKASKVLGVKKVEFLDYRDGELCNNRYHEIAEKIAYKVKQFKPNVIITFEPLGVSGHLDHIALSLMTTFVVIKTRFKGKLYYYCINKERASLFKRYFIYFPPGYPEQEITTSVDVSGVWKTKTRAMRCHTSQLHDVRRILRKTRKLPKVEHFLLFQKEKWKDCSSTDLLR